MPFPLNTCNVGDAVRARVVTHRGEEESNFDFGPFKQYLVTHVQRDRQGNIAEIWFSGVNQGYDPRYDYQGEIATVDGPVVSLMGDAPTEFQIILRR